MHERVGANKHGEIGKAGTSRNKCHTRETNTTSPIEKAPQRTSHIALMNSVRHTNVDHSGVSLLTKYPINIHLAKHVARQPMNAVPT